MSDESVSINKYISNAGICSRREADRYLEQGRVMLNDTVARKGNRVKPGDTVVVDGERIKSKRGSKKVYLALHKPPGVVCTTDQSDADNIIDYLNYPKRIFPVGRLDKASSGLIIMTNDGDIVNRILRQENNHEKEYIVSVNKPIDHTFVKKMSNGLPILGQRTKPCVVKKIKTTIFKIILTQGLNRQIRRMCEHLGYRVVALKRVRVMNINLDGLGVGYFRELTRDEVRGLYGRERGKKKEDK